MRRADWVGRQRKDFTNIYSKEGLAITTAARAETGKTVPIQHRLLRLFGQFSVFKCVFKCLPSRLKVFVYRLVGASIGERVHIGFGSLIIGKTIRIGNNTIIGRHVYMAAEQISVGDFVKIEARAYIPEIKRLKIGEYTIIHEGLRVNGFESLQIGENTWIGRNSTIDVTKDVRISNNVGIGQEAMLWTHGFWGEEIEGYPAKFGKISLEENCWLAPRVIVLPGVNIGRNTIVATGSIVVKNLPPRTLCVGIPAQVKVEEKHYRQSLTRDEKRHLLINCFRKKLTGGGFKLTSLGDSIWECIKDKQCFILVSLDKVIENDIRRIINAYGTKEILIVSSSKVPLTIKTFLQHIKNITIFDVETKKYRKVNTRCETLLKRYTYDHVARFLKEEY